MTPSAPASMPPVAAADVSLREVTVDNLGAVLKLQVAESQKGFVANNSISIAQAHYHPDAWYRAIYAGDEPVGFVMVSDQTRLPEPPATPALGLWRLMIDARHQRRGIGRAAMALLLAHARGIGAYREISTSYVPGAGCPEPFYRSLGFEPTGEVDEDELVMKRPL